MYKILATSTENLIRFQNKTYGERSMNKLHWGIVFLLAGTFLCAGPVGCKTLTRKKKTEPVSKSYVIKREKDDDSTMTGFVGGERPSF